MYRFQMYSLLAGLQLLAVWGTKQDKRSFSTSFFFLEFLKTSLALRMTYMDKVNGVVATVPCSITGFLRKEATGDLHLSGIVGFPKSKSG